MAEVTLTFKGFHELASEFGRYSDLARNHFGPALDRGATKVLADAKQNVARKTSTLTRSLHIERTDEFSRSVGTDVVYGRIRELGGEIHAINKPYLTFQLPDGQWVSVKSVHQTGQPYLVPALEANRDYIEEQFGQAGDALLAEIAGAA